MQFFSCNFFNIIKIILNEFPRSPPSLSEPFHARHADFETQTLRKIVVIRLRSTCPKQWRTTSACLRRKPETVKRYNKQINEGHFRTRHPSELHSESSANSKQRKNLWRELKFSEASTNCELVSANR